MSGRAVLILAGGAGTRLWPLSTDDNPKQFLPLFGGTSLLQQTFDRLAPLAGDATRVFVATNERYREKVRLQLPALPESNILLEFARRNTAPAIAVCCRQISSLTDAAAVGVFPSDHAVGNIEEFRETVRRGFEHAATSEDLVTIGIDPTEPNTGFGYLELGPEIARGIVRLERFVEKPDLATAVEYVKSGRYAWNGGMFLWRLAVFFDALARHAPEIASPAKAYAAANDPAERRAIYEAMPSISIDYALMEKAERIAAVRGDFDWSDVGSWKAVARFAGGTLPPKSVCDDANGIYVSADGSRPIAVVGVDHIAVIDSPDGLLVLDLDHSDRLSAIVKKIEQVDK